MTVTHKVETITPAIAEKILETNTKNRPLGSLTVNRLADQMKNGGWNFDASPIRIDDQGDLIDGQHRLWAVIQSDTTQEFLVVRGLDDSVMSTIDTGKSRRFSDVLSLHDRTADNLTVLAAIVGLVYRWEVKGARGGALRSAGQQQFIPYPLQLAFYDEHADRFKELAHRVGRLQSRGMAQSVIALALWLFEDIDKDDAEFFFERLHDGQGLEVGNAIYTMRQWKLRARDMSPAAPTEVQLAYLIKAWNAYRDGEELKMMVWKRGGSNPEAFPVPH